MNEIAKNRDHGSLREARGTLEKLGTEEVRSALSQEPRSGSSASSIIRTGCQQQPCMAAISKNKNVPSYEHFHILLCS